MRAYFSIFIASAICGWYLVRSRFTKAVMARILGLSGSGAAGLRCVLALAQRPKIAAKNVIAMRASRRREVKRDTLLASSYEWETIHWVETQVQLWC